jgi:ATP-dependent DNA helicase RecG
MSPRPVAGQRIDRLDRPVREVRGIGEQIASRLRARGIETVADLLRVLPRSYEDRRQGGRICDLEEGVPGFAVGTVRRAEATGLGQRRGFRMVVEDSSGGLGCVWFRAHPGLFRLAPGVRVRVSGKPRRYRGTLELIHPDVELVADEDESGPAAFPIVPRYPEIEGVPPRTLWRVIREAATHLEGATDPLPAEVRAARALPGLCESLRAVHAPAANADVEALNHFRDPAQRRLVFEELFALELALARASRVRAATVGIPLSGKGTLVSRLQAKLPFALTSAQKRALAEIVADLCRPHPMSRLLHGDVGSGKTVVALCAALVAIEEGHQVAILTPTEVLAEQHHRVMGGLAAQVGVNAALVTSALVGARRQAVREEVRSGRTRLVVGTQALLDGGVEFAALGLCIVDEQHRLGVLQRAALTAKGPGGATPHLLVMTATPIPRTLAMTLYGDLSLSVLEERPPGRQPVETRILRAAARARLYAWLRRAVEAGARAFVVTPLVESSERLDARDAVRTHAELCAGPLRGLSVGLLHGRLDPEAKALALSRFERGEDRVLVCTTVVEVGIDVPEATILVVEDAERFGLAQLHQLRGRVGRGVEKSHCFLVVGTQGAEEAWKRLKILAETEDGFRIAEEDLRLRGPGEILGTAQSGHPALMVANLLRDAEVLDEAREAAFALVARDPELHEPENRRAWDRLAARYRPILELLRVG